RWGLTLRRNFAQEPQSPRFVPPFLLGTREGQGTHGAGAGLRPAASQEIGLAQPGDTERLLVQESRALGFLQRLLNQRQRLGDTPRAGIGRAQGRGNPGGPEQKLYDLGKSKAPFEHTHSLWEVPLVEGEQAEAEIRNDTADRVIDGLGNLAPFGANSE